MANCENLEIYLTADKLQQELLKLFNDMPRKYKYVLGDDVVRLGNKLQDLIYDVNEALSHREKYQCARQLLRTHYQIVRRMKNIHRLHIINDEKYALFIELFSSIGKQATGWRNYHQCQVNKKKK